MTLDNFPQFQGAFVGRESEIGEVVARLHDPACRLLTLVGPGGIGKTRLATEVGHRKWEDFPHGVWFVSLAPLTTPDQVPTAISQVLRVPSNPESQASQKQLLLDFLRERRLLLILDNFEHLLDGVELVHEMLLAATGITILATSRAALNLQAEWAQPVHGMPYPAPGADGRLEGFSAVQLFAERGRQVRPGFSLAEAGDCVARVCQLVDGVPLAIELAAAWLRAVPCETIVREIEKGLDFLASNRRDVPERHRSMRAVFDHTWSLLTEEEQQVFQRLSVFHGGCTLEAAEAVIGASLPVLASLVEKSLLTLDQAGRYQIHELMRQYGAERLAADDMTLAARDAHTVYFAGFMARLDPKLKGQDQLEALETIEPDFENVRAAWLWALERRHYQAIDQMLEVLDLFCVARSRVDDSYALHAQAWDQLAPIDDEPPHRVWGRVLARPNADFNQEFATIRHRREKALAIARQFDDRLEIATCLYWLAETCNNLYDFHYAIAYLEECVALLRDLGEHFWRARALNELGICHIAMGQPAEAIPYSQAALDLRREIGDRVGMGWCLQDLGIAYYKLGQLDQAERHWHEALGQFQTLGAWNGYNSILFNLRRMSLRNGEFERLSHFSEARVGLSKIAGPPAASWILDALAAGIDGHYEYCLTICWQSLEGGVTLEALFDARFGMAVAACGQQAWDTASDYLTKMLEGIKTEGYTDTRTWKLFCPPIAALVLAQKGEIEQAVELLGRTFANPPHLIGWVKRWSLIADLADDLEAELGQEAYAAAWERGQKRNIDEVIASLRARFVVDVDAQQQVNVRLDEPLTPRELDVLNLIHAGHSNREIAEALVLAESTVKRHINHLYSKLDVESRTQAIARARELNLL